ncbi:MAG: hypothetical protein WCA89_07185 [Terracidiphilus sp.]
MVQPPPLVVGSAYGGAVHVVKYPPYVLVHDSESLWDAHQIKDNLIGIFQLDVVHSLDLMIDGVSPRPHRRPLENGVEWIKNRYAQLPDCAPVRIVGGLFRALEIEKLTVLGGAVPIAVDPDTAISYFSFVRVVYLTDWVHQTLGEMNAAAGHLVPWKGPFIPLAATAPLSRSVYWAQNGAITLYIKVIHKVDAGLDTVIDFGERAWGRVIWICVRPLPE